MTVERTLCIIKPDALEKGKGGAIIQRIEQEGFRVIALRMLRLTRPEAERFYAVHQGRPFFGELVDLMTRSPVIVAALEREGAVARWRDLMGATDPAKAQPGSLRRLFGSNVGENAVHGSDSPENAIREIGFFFSGREVSPTP